MNPYIPGLDVPGWMTELELLWLYQQAGQMTSVVEIGSWMGRSTHALCEGCAEKVISVDTFRGAKANTNGTFFDPAAMDLFREFASNVANFKQLQVFVMESHQAARRFAPLSIDMIFIDGDHKFEEVRLDLRVWMPVAKKLICGHDCSELGVARALDEIDLQIERGPDSLWFARLER